MSPLLGAPLTQGGPTGPSPRPSSGDTVQWDEAAMQKALSDLKIAVDSRKIEAICGAYQALRRQGPSLKVKDLFTLIESALGPDARNIIVSAYSRRACFMCKEGLNLCQYCDGSGHAVSGRGCPNCDGLGMAPCTFCRGTAWAQQESTPHEVRRAVREKQFLHVRQEAQRLAREKPPITSERIAHLETGQRVKLGRWLIKVQARLMELHADQEVLPDSEREQLAKWIAEVDPLVESLAPQTAHKQHPENPPAKDDEDEE